MCYVLLPLLHYTKQKITARVVHSVCGSSMLHEMRKISAKANLFEINHKKHQVQWHMVPSRPGADIQFLREQSRHPQYL